MGVLKLKKGSPAC